MDKGFIDWKNYKKGKISNTKINKTIKLIDSDSEIHFQDFNITNFISIGAKRRLEFKFESDNYSYSIQNNPPLSYEYYLEEDDISIEDKDTKTNIKSFFSAFSKQVNKIHRIATYRAEKLNLRKLGLKNKNIIYTEIKYNELRVYLKEPTTNHSYKFIFQMLDDNNLKKFNNIIPYKIIDNAGTVIYSDEVNLKTIRKTINLSKINIFKDIDEKRDNYYLKDVYVPTDVNETSNILYKTSINFDNLTQDITLFKASASLQAFFNKKFSTNTFENVILSLDVYNKLRQKYKNEDISNLLLNVTYNPEKIISDNGKVYFVNAENQGFTLFEIEKLTMHFKIIEMTYINENDLINIMNNSLYIVFPKNTIVNELYKFYQEKNNLFSNNFRSISLKAKHPKNKFSILKGFYTKFSVKKSLLFASNNLLDSYNTNFYIPRKEINILAKTLKLFVKETTEIIANTLNNPNSIQTFIFDGRKVFRFNSDPFQASGKDRTIFIDIIKYYQTLEHLYLSTTINSNIDFTSIRYVRNPKYFSIALTDPYSEQINYQIIREPDSELTLEDFIPTKKWDGYIQELKKEAKSIEYIENLIEEYNLNFKHYYN